MIGRMGPPRADHYSTTYSTMSLDNEGTERKSEMRQPGKPAKGPGEIKPPYQTISDHIIHSNRGLGVITLAKHSPYLGYITDGPGDLFFELFL